MKKRMQRRASKYVVALAVASLMGCGVPEDEATDEETGTPNEYGVNESDVRTAVPDMGVLLLDLPSSLAPASSSGGLRLDESEGEGEGGLSQLVLMPRMFVGIADEMNSLVKQITYHLFGKPACRDSDTSNDPSDCAEFPGIVRGAITTTPTIFEIPEDPDDPGAPNYVKYFKNEAGSTYDYTFEMYWKNASDGLYYKGMQLLVSKTGDETGKGKMTFLLSAAGEEEEGAPEAITTSFDNTDGTASMSVNMYGMASESDPDQPDRMGLRIDVDENGLLTGAGAVIRKELAQASGGFAPFETAPEFAWVFTLAGNTSEDAAVQAMAFPQVDNYSDTENFFTNYGLDDIMNQFLMSFLRNQSDDWDCSNTTMTNYIFGINESMCASNTNVTDQQVLNAYNTYCENSGDNSGLCGSTLRSATEWSNPIYLDATGYVGNEVKNKPTDAKFDGLATALSDIAIYTPADLSAETVPDLGEGVAAVE